MLTLFNIPIHEVCHKFDKNCIKTLKVWNFFVFCLFHFQFEIFKLKSCNYLFEEDYWTTNLFLVDSFQHSNLRSLSKFWQKLHETFENWKNLNFLSHSVSIWYIFIWKTALISSEKPTGQRIPAMLSVFNILIHEVYRKFDKNSIKTLKIEKFWNFCQLWCKFSFKKPHLYFHRTLLDNVFVPCWTFSTF